MTALLTVDWDFFNRRLFEAADRTPEDRGQLGLWDWGHREAPFFLFDVWPIRAAGFLRAGLPLPGTTGEEVAFWARCAIRPDARLFYGESHVLAAHQRIAKGVTEVVNVDAHHDAGYRRPHPEKVDVPRWARDEPPDVPDSLDCGNWAYRYLLAEARYRVVYPRWRDVASDKHPDWRTVEQTVDRGGEITSQSGRPFDTVYVCRSGAWVPPWNDPQFRRFLYTLAPSRRWRVLGRRSGGTHLRLPVRGWDDATAREYVKQFEETHALLRERAARMATMAEVPPEDR